MKVADGRSILAVSQESKMQEQLESATRDHSKTWRRMCLLNDLFRRVKYIFFNRWVLWGVGLALAVGLPLAQFGMASNHTTLILAGCLLAMPFVLWVSLLALVCFVLAVPRFIVLGLLFTAFYLGLTSVNKWLADWLDGSESALQE